MADTEEPDRRERSRLDAELALREASMIGRDAERVRAFARRKDPFWPTQLTVLIAIALDLGLPDKLTIGSSRWLLPGVEALLLVGLVGASPTPTFKHAALRRQVAMGLIGFVSAVNLYSLIMLAHYLLQGGKVGGRPLILAGLVLWWTNVLLFGLWFWELDRGGPMARLIETGAKPDFLFPQMSQKALAPDGWLPGLIDYLYTSFTNATAFSPTDTLPLTPIAKVLMTVQSFAALTTVGLVLARAVNILS
jgi:hypothetical protein